MYGKTAWANNVHTNKEITLSSTNYFETTLYDCAHIQKIKEIKKYVK